MGFNEEPITILAGSRSFERVCSSETGKLCLDLIGSVSQKTPSKFSKICLEQVKHIVEWQAVARPFNVQFWPDFGSEIRGSYYRIVVSVCALK